MAINGSLDEASLADVLQLLSFGRKTGRLSVSDQSNLGHVYLDTGKITHAFLVNRRQRLGDILFKSGHITQDQLSEVITKQEKSPEKKVGEILVETGAISEDALRRNMQVQIEEAVYFLFTWRRGDFAFERDVKPDPEDFLVSINPEALLLEGARRVDEWSVIEKKIPSFDMVFTVDKKRLESSDAKLSDEQKRIASMLDGARDVAAIVAETGMIEFDVGQALYGLITAGFSEAVGPSGVDGPGGSASNDRSGHLDHDKLLAYLAHQAEFADEKRRRQSGLHIADCPTCSKRLQEIHVRRSQGLPAIPDQTDTTVDESETPAQSSNRRSVPDRRSGAKDPWDHDGDRRVHGAGDRRSATREAAVQRRPPVERRKLDDRRAAESRKRQRRRPAPVDRSDRAAVERRRGLERRLHDRRAVPRRLTDIKLGVQDGHRQTAAMAIGAGFPGSSGATAGEASPGASRRSRSENHSARQTGAMSASRSGSALPPKNTRDAGAPEVPNQGSPPTPKPSDSTTPSPTKRATRPSVRRMRESPLRGIPLLADGTEWRFVERVETEAELEAPQPEELDSAPDAAAISSPKTEPAAEPATLDSGAETAVVDTKPAKPGERTTDIDIVVPVPDVAQPARKTSRWWSRTKPPNQEVESAKRELEREKRELEQAKKELAKAKSEAAETKLDAEQAKSEAAQARVEADNARKRAEKAEAEADEATTKAKTVKSDAVKRKSEAVQTKSEVKKAKLELEKAKAEAEEAREEAQKEKLEAEKAKSEAEKATANAVTIKSEAAQTESEVSKAKKELAKAKSEAAKTKLDAEQAKSEAEQARVEAEKARKRAEKTEASADEATTKAKTVKSDAVKRNSEAVQTKSEVKKAKLELEKVKAEAEEARKEAQKAKLEAEKARSEAETAKSDVEQARLEVQRAKSEADELIRESETAEWEAEEATTEYPQHRIGRGTPVTLSQPKPRSGRGTPVSLSQLFGAAARGSRPTLLESAPKEVQRGEDDSSPSKPLRKRPMFWVGLAAATVVATAAGWFARPFLTAGFGSQTASANTPNLTTETNPPAGSGIPVVVADSARQDSQQYQTPAEPTEPQLAAATPSTTETPVQTEAESPVAQPTEVPAENTAARVDTAAPPVQPGIDERPTQADAATLPPPAPEQEQQPIDAAPTGADPVVSTVTITGSVRAIGTGTAVGGALVLMPDLDLSTRTDATGSFSFDGVPAGSLSVAVELDGYMPEVETIVAEAGENVVLDLELRGPPNALEPDEELDGGQWAITDRAEAEIVLGSPVAIIADLWIESIARPATGTRPRVRVAQLTESGTRITLVESRSGPANVAAIPRVTALRIIPPTEAYPITTGTASFGNLLVTAKATLTADSLRSFLRRLSESDGN